MSETKLSSLSIFFPFFNDAGTVNAAIDLAYSVGRQVTKNLEVIALHGGPSHDSTWEMIQKAKRRYPRLKVINKKNNTEGYAVIKHGFEGATKDWIFYTDGDLQYDVTELKKLVVTQLKTKVDVVNGYKQHRGDNVLRTWLGTIWQNGARLLFKLPIRDIDCDFRLIRSSLLKKISLRSSGASILEELLIRLQQQGATFAEIPITHRHRTYGHSNYTWWQLVWEKVTGMCKLWFRL